MNKKSYSLNSTQNSVLFKKRKGKINLGQMVNEYRKKTGYFSPAQTRDRESTYAQPQGKKGTYSYRARGR